MSQLIAQVLLFPNLEILQVIPGGPLFREGGPDCGEKRPRIAPRPLLEHLVALAALVHEFNLAKGSLSRDDCESRYRRISEPPRRPSHLEREPFPKSCVARRQTMTLRNAYMTRDARRPLPDDLDALMQIISGRAADLQTIQRLVNCDLVEEFDGTALLTLRGIEAAAALSSAN